ILQTEDKGVEFMRLVVNKSLPFARLAGASAAVAYQLQNIALHLENALDYSGAAAYYRAALHTLRGLSGQHEHKLEIFSKAARNAVLLKNYDQTKHYLDSARYYVKLIPHSTYVPAF